MATKKGSKSTKTAHVLNVLSGGKQENPAEEDKLTAEEPEAKSEEQAVLPSRPPVRAPILEMARANDEVLSDQIQQLLEEDWENEEPQEEALSLSEEAVEIPAPIAEEEPSVSKNEEEPVSPPIQESKLLEEVPVMQEPVNATKEEPEVLQEPKEVAPIPEEQAPVHLEQETQAPKVEEDKKLDFCHVNVMQVLVEEKCMRYIKMFGMCDCSRCVADVKALALTNLMPKYLVMRQSDVVPMLTVYEGRLNAAVTAQLIQACSTVMEHPRH